MWPFKKRQCVACEHKDEFLKGLMDRELRECSACKNHAHEIEHLKNENNRAWQAWREERAEYKRTIDRLLEQVKIRPVGQGAPPETPPTAPTIDQLVGIFDEEG